MKYAHLLLEVIVVIAILATVASIVSPIFS